MDSAKFVDLSCRYPDCITHALHTALRYHASDELILALLANYKDSTREKSLSGGGLPLHKAIESNYSDEVVLALLEANPGAAMVDSDNGELPLHQAIKRGYSDAVVMEIFLSFPSAAMIRCKQTGMLPLHLAASTSASPLLVKALIKEYPEALDIKVRNCTPRDLVTSSLPVESIKIICRPSLYWLNLLSNMASEKSATFTSSSSNSSNNVSFERINELKQHDYPYDYSLVDGQRIKQDLFLGKSYRNTDEKDIVLSELSEHVPIEHPPQKPPEWVEIRNRTFRKPRSPGVTPKGHVQNFVQHDYHDHSAEPPWETELSWPNFKLDDVSTFPMKLHMLLSKVEADGLSDVISWQPHGRAFKIHDRIKFVEAVMPIFFRQTKFESFRRQLCLYGFLSISQGPDKGALYHELFLRGRAYLAKRIIRQRLKGTKIRTVASPETEPNFYYMPYMDGQMN
jgi:hypothetical protein